MVFRIPPLPYQYVVCHLPDEHSSGRIILLSLYSEGCETDINCPPGPNFRPSRGMCIRNFPDAVLIDGEANGIVEFENMDSFRFDEHSNLKASR
jgi:hypothetical protein